GHQENGRSSRPGVVGQKRAPQQSRNSEHLEHVWRNQPAVELLSALPVEIKNVSPAAADYLIENMVLFLEIEKFRVPKPCPSAGTILSIVMNRDHDDALRVDVREGIQ